MNKTNRKITTYTLSQLHCLINIKWPNTDNATTHKHIDPNNIYNNFFLLKGLTPYPADHDFVVFNLFDQTTTLVLLGMKCVSKHQELQMFAHKINKYE